MAVIRMSFTNLADATGATAYATGQACGYCSTQAQQPQRPFLPWRSLTTTTTQEWLLDMGSSQTLDVVALVHAGFTSATIEGASSSGLFAAAPYSEAVTVARNPVQWRFQHAHVATGFGYRWLRVTLDATTATCADGATLGSTYWSLGGVWAGVLTSAPTHLQSAAFMRGVLPQALVGPNHRGWEQRLKLGEPRAQVDGVLSAGVTPATPALGDELDTWSDLIRQCWSADYFYAYMNLGDPSQGYVVRWRDDPTYAFEGTRATIQVLLDEVVGP